MAPSPPRRTSRRTLLASAAGLLLAGCGAGLFERRPQADVTATPPPSPLALTRGRVAVDGALQAATVVVAGGRIIAAAPEAEIPDGARQIDCTGQTLLPGFIDCHVHVQFSTAAAILGGGVTTVRDLGSPPDQALAMAGQTPLRVLAAGRILTAVAGYPSRSWGADGTAREVGDAADAAVAVREQADAGATVIKVALEPAAGPVLDEDALRVAVDTAHALGLRVTAHVGAPKGLAMALDTGVDELAHLPLYDVTPPEMVRAAQAGMALVPTLEIRGDDPGAQRAVAAFREAGGRVVYGSDLGNGGTAPGIEVTEIRALLGAGMTPAEVLTAATAGAAEYLGLDEVGRIAAGAAADLVAVDGDPFADPAVYDDVRLVFAGGVPVVNRLDG